LSQALENKDAGTLLDAHEHQSFQIQVGSFDDFCLRDDIIIERAKLCLDGLNGRFRIVSELTLDEARVGNVPFPSLLIDNKSVALNESQSLRLRNIARSYWEKKAIVSKIP
jgi:hypothetical protein